MSASDSTQADSFPPYAELSRTAAWSQAPGRVDADADTFDVEASYGARYTEGATLGVGGMGKVVLARDARIGRDVAVKMLHARRDLDAADRARFLREAKVQGQLEHPSIVPVYDIDRREDGTTYFTMRRVQGRTLHAILDELRAGDATAQARFSQRELLTAFATVCLTIDYAHSRGVVHRDLKPTNIMLGDFGEVYVLDWGLAHLVGDAAQVEDGPQERLSMPGAFLGTPLYMAPEQMADPDVGPAADVYSLGLILFEILTLQRARDPQAIFAPVDARPRTRAPARDVAPELETICVRATELEPADRYPSPRALQEAIARFLEGDRELEQRRQLARGHVQAARTALERSTEPAGGVDERQRGIAMRELQKAIALDPTDGETVTMLADIMARPPTEVPPEVQTQLRDVDEKLVKLGAKHTVTAMASWWLFLPVLLWIGIHDGQQLVWIAVPVIGAALAAIVMIRQRVAGVTTQLVAIGLLQVATMMLSRLYGPFILVPALMTTNAIVLQAHPLRVIRIWGWSSAAIAMLVAAALDWSGAWPGSYVLADGTWQILPQALDLPRTQTFTFLALTTVVAVAVPCAFIAKLRVQLQRAQTQLALQAWHFRRLGTQLTEVAP